MRATVLLGTSTLNMDVPCTISRNAGQLPSRVCRRRAGRNTSKLDQNKLAPASCCYHLPQYPGYYLVSTTRNTSLDQTRGLRMSSKGQAADLVLQGLAHMVHREYHLAKRSFVQAQQLNPGYPGIQQLVDDAEAAITQRPLTPLERCFATAKHCIAAVTNRLQSVLAFLKRLWRPAVD